MKNCCEKCGKELGFFERSLKINNSRINIQYDALCSECHKTIKEGISQIDEMYQRVMGNLKENYRATNMAAVDIDTLIFLAVEALLVIEPNYFSDKTSLNQTIINRTDRIINKQNDMAKIVYKVLLYGFFDNLENNGLDKSKNFVSYMMQNTLYMEQLSMNCSEEVPRTYVNAFFSRKGFIMERIEKKTLLYVMIKDETVIDYEMKQTEDYYLIDFKNLFYTGDPGKNVQCYVNGVENAKTITKTIDNFNTKTTKKEERRIRDTLNIINEKVVRDLKSLKPDEAIDTIHLDCVLLCIAKNIRNDPEGRKSPIQAPDGLTVDLLWKKYTANLALMGIDSKEKAAEYIAKNCLYADGFHVKYGKKDPETGWAFFTTKGYIVAFDQSKRLFFMYTDDYPNDLYFPCNEMMFNGRQYLQLPMEDEVPNDDELDGILFFSRDVKLIMGIGHYFERNNMFYQMENFIEVEEAVYGDPEQLMEVKRVSDHLFRDFGYMPFCLYDEWYVIQKELRQDDILLNRLIPEKSGLRKRYATGDVIYAPKILDAFKNGARELQDNLEIMGESIAKGLLWCYFKASLIDTLSKEWVRIGGDILAAGDDLVTAFFKYSSLKTIEPEKTYYIGLFIYYLMDKNILPDTDFLDNYERAVQTFLECKREVDRTLAEQPAEPITQEINTEPETPRPQAAPADAAPEPEFKPLNWEDDKRGE
ncbi:hypothetical protein SAMN04515624_12840 [Eubacterium maltosivorans]|uniref:hypothetical protein n=1 Tax=Eubacterium maltosivorans TaxID=2041044 RepID=UPI0008868BA0|nr:hypothetical protein [Eubacterium maltosivorans]WPK81409.1 hypothetical protein EUMA32_28600 [Eubacterium maltosivorans]SDP76840.1 hypothetical protein SAMN04515624_12840 [Eubacterium maltosivorans]